MWKEKKGGKKMHEEELFWIVAVYVLVAFVLFILLSG